MYLFLVGKDFLREAKMSKLIKLLEKLDTLTKKSWLRCSVENQIIDLLDAPIKVRKEYYKKIRKRLIEDKEKDTIKENLKLWN